MRDMPDIYHSYHKFLIYECTENNTIYMVDDDKGDMKMICLDICDIYMIYHLTESLDMLKLQSDVK